MRWRLMKVSQASTIISYTVLGNEPSIKGNVSAWSSLYTFSYCTNRRGHVWSFFSWRARFHQTVIRHKQSNEVSGRKSLVKCITALFLIDKSVITPNDHKLSASVGAGRLTFLLWTPRRFYSLIWSTEPRMPKQAPSFASKSRKSSPAFTVQKTQTSVILLESHHSLCPPPAGSYWTLSALNSQIPTFIWCTAVQEKQISLSTQSLSLPVFSAERWQLVQSKQPSSRCARFTL